MTLVVQIIGIFSGISSLATLCILIITPIRERILGIKDDREGRRCLLRSDMLHIYYKNKESEQIRQYEKENFLFEYKAYKALGGNSFIDDIYEDLRHWDVVT